MPGKIYAWQIGLLEHLFGSDADNVVRYLESLGYEVETPAEPEIPAATGTAETMAEQLRSFSQEGSGVLVSPPWWDEAMVRYYNAALAQDVITADMYPLDDDPGATIGAAIDHLRQDGGHGVVIPHGEHSHPEDPAVLKIWSDGCRMLENSWAIPPDLGFRLLRGEY